MARPGLAWGASTRARQPARLCEISLCHCTGEVRRRSRVGWLDPGALGRPERAGARTEARDAEMEAILRLGAPVRAVAHSTENANGAEQGTVRWRGRRSRAQTREHRYENNSGAGRGVCGGGGVESE
eukprot:scaffold3541_cov117-Isochrysis_galbana.AAC.8